jgi:hypothetical protein
VGEDRRDLAGQAVGIARGGAFPGEFFERLRWRKTTHGCLFGILIGEPVEREAATFGDVNRACQPITYPFPLVCCDLFRKASASANIVNSVSEIFACCACNFPSSA